MASPAHGPARQITAPAPAPGPALKIGTATTPTTPPSRGGSLLSYFPGLGACFLTTMAALGAYDYFKAKPDTRPFGSDLMDTTARAPVNPQSWAGLQALIGAAKSDPKFLPETILTINRLSSNSSEVLALAKSIGGRDAVLAHCVKAEHPFELGVGYPALGVHQAAASLKTNPQAGDVVLARAMKAVLDCALFRLELASTEAGGTHDTLPSAERLKQMGNPSHYHKCLDGLSDLLR